MQKWVRVCAQKKKLSDKNTRYKCSKMRPFFPQIKKNTKINVSSIYLLYCTHAYTTQAYASLPTHCILLFFVALRRIRVAKCFSDVVLKIIFCLHFILRTRMLHSRGIFLKRRKNATFFIGHLGSTNNKLLHYKQHCFTSHIVAGLFLTPLILFSSQLLCVCVCVHFDMNETIHKTLMSDSVVKISRKKFKLKPNSISNFAREM